MSSTHKEARRDDHGAGDQEKELCFLVVAQCLEWLLKETSRIPGGAPKWDYGRLTQDDADKAARPLLVRALKSEDEDFHLLIYETLFKLEEKGLVWLKCVTTPYIRVITKLEDIIYVRAASPCPFLFHKDDDEPIFSFAQDFLARKTEEAEASLGSGRNYVQEYLEYHGRYGEAVEQLQGMITKDRTRLELRIRYLVAAIQCLSKGLASSSSDVTLRYQQNADKLKELEDQLDLAKLQERLLIELRSLPQRETLGQEEVRVIEDRCRELDENLLLPNNLFRLTKKYTLWELSLKLIDVCNTSQSDVQNAVEGLWRNMIFNELPTNPRSQALHNKVALKSADSP